MSLPELRTLVRAPASTESAWNELTAALASVLGVLEEDDVLCVGSKRFMGFVRLICMGRHGLRAEAIGNYHLAPKWKLDAGQVGRMIDLGWSPPTADEPSPEWDESDPDFSSMFYLEIGLPLPHLRVAELAMTTLREVYRVHHPRELDYDAWGRGVTIKLPTLGLMLRPPRQAA